MSDIDRLRAAAHILDTVSHPTPFSTTCAALLRAVADYQEQSPSTQCLYCDAYPVDPHGYGCPWEAALALADVILGASDE